MSRRRDEDHDRRDRIRDDDLADLLDDLGTTLEELRRELRASPDYRRGRRRRRFRPPTPREILRFTEEYTIPTVIAVLEANIRALELLGRLLRLADPERALREESDAARTRMDAVRRDAVDGLEGALSELRAALSEADLPENPESRSIIEDARELADEIESQIAAGRDRARDRRESDRAGGISIAVDEEDPETPPDASRGDETTDDDSEDDAPGVDIDAELDSIRDELERAERGDDSARDGDDE
ncbi:DUF7547 family protein [Halegenticoccus tardaugens]|uniref:DUF7547 family protein n=1 Tax=Halegenticoccus tardaugens TaxID=2071624 RepID=UPI00100B3201|nr:hypothetical protein [Halegenticoccus tardaugens]